MLANTNSHSFESSATTSTLPSSSYHPAPPHAKPLLSHPSAMSPPFIKPLPSQSSSSSSHLSKYTPPVKSPLHSENKSQRAVDSFILLQTV